MAVQAAQYCELAMFLVDGKAGMGFYSDHLMVSGNLL